MPRTKKGTPPSYRRHSSGQAVVTVRQTDGQRRDILLGPGDGHLALLQGLTQHLQAAAVELRQFVQEQHALMKREKNAIDSFTRLAKPASAMRSPPRTGSVIMLRAPGVRAWGLKPTTWSTCSWNAPLRKYGRAT